MNCFMDFYAFLTHISRNVHFWFNRHLVLTPKFCFLRDLPASQIFDSTHAEGKNNVLLFKLGEAGAVISGIQDMVSNMYVGQKVQAIIPPELAFGEKGICLEDNPDECLIKPRSTLVYDISLKKSTIPPP